MEEELKKDPITFSIQKIWNIAGATASILIITSIASLINLIPRGITISIGLFVSLPLAFTFIFGIITNKKNFSSVIRHYSFGAYVILTMIIYFIYMKPDSFIIFGKYFAQFLIGFVIAGIAGLFYTIPYILLKNQKYRWRALSGFLVSFIVTFTIFLVLKIYGVFEWLV